MIKWIKDNRDSIIRNSFLLPIVLVVIMSISHVISWYDIGNPYSWAIYLSIGIEIFALASVSASSIKMSRGSIWFLFGLVTLIQIIGNVYYGFKDINPIGQDFVDWMLLIQPIFEDFEVLDHRRFLALIQGGTLPLMSLTALHFYIKFGDKKEDDRDNDDNDDDTPPIAPVAPKSGIIKVTDDTNIQNETNVPSDITVVDQDVPSTLTNSDRPDSEALEIDAKAEEELNKIEAPSISELEEEKEEKEAKFHFQIPDKKLSNEIDPRTGKYKIM